MCEYVYKIFSFFRQKFEKKSKKKKKTDKIDDDFCMSRDDEDDDQMYDAIVYNVYRH